MFPEFTRKCRPAGANLVLAAAEHSYCPAAILHVPRADVSVTVAGQAAHKSTGAPPVSTTLMALAALFVTSDYPSAVLSHMHTAPASMGAADVPGHRMV